MKKKMLLAALLGLLTVGFVAPAAQAVELQDCVSSNAVCSYDGATISDSGAVASAVGDKLKVAVVNPEEVDVVSANQLASQLASATNTQELVVIVDMATDRFGVYSASGKSNEILEALNSAGVADGGEALIAADLESLYASTAVSQRGEEGAPVGAVVGGSVAFLAVVILSAIGVRIFKRRSTGEVDSEARITEREMKSVEFSEALAGELRRLQQLSRHYSRSAGDQNLKDSVRTRFMEAAKSMDRVHLHVYELFRRIDRKNARQTRAIAQARYMDTLQKLNSTLSIDYFGDIMLNPNLWEDSDAKVTTILEALSSVDRQIIDNIKQVNSSKDLEFKVALDILLSSDSIDVKEAYRTGE